MRLERVRAHAQHHRAALLEVLHVLVERQDLGRAHEREVERIEEQHHVLPFELGQREGLDVVIAIHRGRGEIRGGLANEDGHDGISRKRMDAAAQPQRHYSTLY